GCLCFFFQAEDGIRDGHVTGVQTCALPISKVALRDGGHWVVVAGQVARDAAGDVVGKGDLRAQIEQVGKNIGACLDAGGATIKEIGRASCRERVENWGVKEECEKKRNRQKG